MSSAAINMPIRPAVWCFPCETGISSFPPRWCVRPTIWFLWLIVLVRRVGACLLLVRVSVRVEHTTKLRKVVVTRSSAVLRLNSCTSSSTATSASCSSCPCQALRQGMLEYYDPMPGLVRRRNDAELRQDRVFAVLRPTGKISASPNGLARWTIFCIQNVNSQ